jgi:hypothetical protein
VEHHPFSRREEREAVWAISHHIACIVQIKFHKYSMDVCIYVIVIYKIDAYNIHNNNKLHIHSIVFVVGNEFSTNKVVFTHRQQDMCPLHFRLSSREG